MLRYSPPTPLTAASYHSWGTAFPFNTANSNPLKKGGQAENGYFYSAPRGSSRGTACFTWKPAPQKMRWSFNCRKMFKCGIFGELPEIMSTLVSPSPKVDQEPALKSTASNGDHRPSFHSWLSRS